MSEGTNINQLRAEIRDILSFGELVALQKFENTKLEVLQLFSDEANCWESALDARFISKVRAILENKKTKQSQKAMEIAEKNLVISQNSHRLNEENLTISQKSYCLNKWIVGFTLAGIVIGFIALLIAIFKH